MAFENLKNFADMLNFKASNISTKWDGVKTSDYFYEYPNYDYFPILKDKKLVGMSFRNSDDHKEEIDLQDSNFLQEEADILDVIDRLKTNYRNCGEKAGFLILGSKEKPRGLITFADLNREEVSALIWRIIKSVEINLKKCLAGLTRETIVNSLQKERVEDLEKRKNGDQKTRMDLDFVNYLSLGDIKKIVNKQKNYLPNVYEITKSHLTKDVINLRNNVSHHKVRKSLISNREEIYKLHRTLSDFDYLHANLSRVMQAF